MKKDRQNAEYLHFDGPCGIISFDLFFF